MNPLRVSSFRFQVAAATAQMLLGAGVLLLTPSVWAATYHVRQGGGGDCITIKGCLDRLQPGDTLLVHAGTYVEGNITHIPSGASWTAPVTVAAASGERVVVQIPSGADGLHLTGYAGTDVGFIIIDGFIFDCSSADYNCVKLESYQTRIHDVIVRNNEIFGNPKGSGILGGGDRVQIINNDIHDNGLIPSDNTLAWCGYGMYVAGIDMYIARNRIHDNGGWGIHHYTSSGGARNNVIESNYVYDNGLSCNRSNGIILASGDNIQAFNNVVFNNRHQGIGVLYGANSKVFNNTVFNNGSEGILYAAQSGAEIANNIAFNNAGGNIIDGGSASGISLTANLTTDPRFVNLAADDFHLQAGSPAIDAGVDLSAEGVTADFEGTSRPQGVAFDIGAYEYGGSSPSAPTLTFSANPTSIMSGSSSTLSWSATNASSCSASGGWSGAKATSGTQSVTPTAATTYSLTCSGSGGSVSKSVTVNVSGGVLPPLIPQSVFSLVSVDSEETVGEDGRGINAIDGDPATFWHTEWYNASPPHPHTLILQLAGTYQLQGLRYLPRQDGILNGTIQDYQLFVSVDGLSWGSAVKTGTLPADALPKDLFFPAMTGRFVKLMALSEVQGYPWTSAAEIQLFGSLSSSLLGDLDGDGRLTLTDVRWMIQMLVGTRAVDLSAADLTQDGKLSLLDVQTLIKRIVGVP